MKNSVQIIFFLFSMFLNAQNVTDKTDEMIDAMCLKFKETENLNDSIRIEILNQRFIFPFLDQFSEAERESKIDNLYFRFQKRCEFFRDYLQKVDPPKNDNWVRLALKPNIILTDTEIKTFRKNENFYYFEYSGDKTNVKTNKNYWIETFSDGTNSKLLFRWKDKSKFELEFVESNNNTRNNFSKKGEKYNYEIISKESDFYWILVEIPGQSELLKFKLFVEN